MKNKYYNFCCRKCGGYITVYTAKNLNNTKGTLLDNKKHRHCKLSLENGEQVFCDLVSVSDHLIDCTVDMIDRSL